MPSSPPQSLTLSSSIPLPASGPSLTVESNPHSYPMPLLGFGLFQNYVNATDAVLEALRAGYRHLDSAQCYYNEEQVGEGVREWVKEREGDVGREDVFVTTKCVSQTHGYESTLRGVDASLAKMGFDYIDLFLIHDPLSGRDLRLATYKALLEAQAAGKIRSVGVSNYNIKHMDEIKFEFGLDCMPAVNQIELHPFCQQKEIVRYCDEHNIIVQAYCPIIRGKKEYLEHPSIRELADKHTRDPAQILIRWSLQRGFVPLPKSATPSRIRSNADVYNFELSKEDMQMLDVLDRGKAGGVSWNPVDAD